MMTFSADGSRLAIATTLGVWVIDVSGKGAPQLLDGQSGAESVTFSPDESMIAAGGDDHSVMIFDAATGKTIARLTNHIYPISAVAWSDDGKWVASGDWSGVVRLWDTSTWSEKGVIASETSRIMLLQFNPDSTQLQVWDVSNLSVLDMATDTVLSRTLGDRVYPIAASVGDLSASYNKYGDEDIEIDEKQNILATLKGFYGELGDVFFTSDGNVGAHPFTLPLVFSTSTGQRTNSTVFLPVTSPDGSRRATFGNDGVIRLFDTKSGSLIAQLHGHIRAINAVAFSPDGKLLASASNDDTIQLWDATVTQDSGSLMVLTDLNGGVSSIAFNSDGTLLASAGYDGTIRVWGIKN